MERESSAYENIKLITPERDSASKLANRLKHVGGTTVEKKTFPPLFLSLAFAPLQIPLCQLI
jgi:hypothetical protein